MITKIFALSLLIICKNVAYTQTANPAEAKVDYLEKIYFSGKNKADLNTMISATIQQIEALPSTTSSVLKQYAYLKGIKPQAEAAANACDVEELIAAGIFEIDIAEAQTQNVHAPGNKAKANAEDALKSLGGVTTALGNTSGTLTNLAWRTYVTTGKTSGFGTASKLAGVSNNVGAAVDIAGQGASLVSGTKGALKSLGLGPKDKPCKSVIARDIQIGEHAVTPQVNTALNINPTPPDPVQPSPSSGPMAISNVTAISISGADYAKLSNINERLKNCATVSEAKMKFDINGSLINVSHSGTVEDLLSVMLSACKGLFSEKNVSALNPDERKISLKLP